MDKQEHEDLVRKIVSSVTSSGLLKSRESNTVEFKENFNASNTSKYAKTMAAFANNKGGYIIFGITDRPRTIKGLLNENFDNLNQEQFTENINNMFSPSLDWDCGSLVTDISQEDGTIIPKKIGWIYTAESDFKPVIALKNIDGEKVSSGDVIFRYRARSQKIKYAEMSKIISDNISRERDRLFKLFDAIKNSNTTNLGIVNYANGKFSTPYGIDVEFDRKLVAQVLKKAKFIKEGKFSETEGIPVIKVTGNIDLAEEVPVLEGNPDETYPYRQKDLANKLGISTYEVCVFTYHYKMKENKAHHFEISASKKAKLHKFSEYALKFLQKKIEETPVASDEFKKMKEAYNNRNKETNNG